MKSSVCGLRTPVMIGVMARVAKTQQKAMDPTTMTLGSIFSAVAGMVTLSPLTAAAVNFDTTLFIWSRNGQKFMLPDGVGFKIGAGSRIKHLVLQVRTELLFFKYTNSEDLND